MQTGSDEQQTIDTIAAILGSVKYKDWHFFVGEDGTRLYLQVQFLDTSNVNPDETSVQKGRKWLLSPFMTKSEVVMTAFKAVKTAEEHEVRENFRYKGRMIFGPHIDVDALATLVAKKANLDMRTGRWV